MNDPIRFIEEKLQKKFLSINTVRDGIMAAILISLQEMAEQNEKITDLEAWNRTKASEIRKKADEAFAAIKAPSEYPSQNQLQHVTASLKDSYGLNQLPPAEKEAFEARCKALFEKLEDTP